MSKKIPMMGKKFGKLTVIKEEEKDHRGFRYTCLCDCGNKAENVSGPDLRSGHKTSCGCNFSNRRKTHGLSNSKIRNAYYNMKRRCDNPNFKDYKNYGGRGITYCEKWNTFQGFLDDMETTYIDGLTLDRIEVNGNYCKENCRWADKKTQANNTRANHIAEYKGEILTLAEMAEKYNVDYELFRHRILDGWPVERALFEKQELETITFNGETKTIGEFARERGMKYYQLKKRLMRGWTVERALTQPLRKSSSNK